MTLVADVNGDAATSLHGLRNREEDMVLRSQLALLGSCLDASSLKIVQFIACSCLFVHSKGFLNI
jgi:hypothetical protein